MMTVIFLCSVRSSFIDDRASSSEVHIHAGYDKHTEKKEKEIGNSENIIRMNVI
jgi:hypothetical protein